MGYDRDKIKDVIYIVDMIDDLQALMSELEFPDSAHMYSSYEYENNMYKITWNREENPNEVATRMRAEEHEKNLAAHKENLRVKAEKAEYERLHAIYGGDDVGILEEEI